MFCTLIENTDYTITSGNKGTDIGNYTLKITGTGNYKDEAEKSWSIVEKTGAVSEVTLDKTAAYIGDTITAAVTGTDGVVTITYPASLGGGSENVTITNGTATGTAKTVKSAATGEKVSAQGLGQSSAVESAAFTTYDKAITLTAPSSQTTGTAAAWTVSIPLAADLTVTLEDNGSSAGTITGLGDVTFTAAGEASQNVSITASEAGSLKLKATAAAAGWTEGTAEVTVTDPVLYTVSYDLNGCTGGTAPASRTQSAAGETLTVAAVPSGITAPAGKVLAGGWNTKADGTGTNYAAGASITPAEDTTLFVKLNASAPTTVSFDANGGTGTPASVSVSFGDAMPALAAADLPTKTGYTFEGFFDAAAGGKQYYNADGSSAAAWDKTDAAATLYAQWTVNEAKDLMPTEGKVTIPEDKRETIPADLENPVGVKMVEVDGVESSVTFKASTDVTSEPGSVAGFHAPTVFTRFEITTTAAAGQTKFVIDVENKEGMDSRYIFLRHCSESGWDNSHIAGKAIPGADEGWQRFEFPVDKCSPFAVVYEEPVKQSSGSSSSGGSSTWATPTPEPAVTPEPTASPTLEMPTVKPITTQTPQAKTPAPVMGILAGLGAAGVLFGIRRR